MECVGVGGKRLKQSEEGGVGLLREKKALQIQAGGGQQSEGGAAEVEGGEGQVGRMGSFF